MKEILTFIINPFFIVTLLFLGGLLSSRLKNKIKLFFYSSLVFIVCSAPITSIIFSYPLIKSVQVVNKDNEKKIRSVIVLGAGIKKKYFRTMDSKCRV